MSHISTSADELRVRVRKIAGQVGAIDRALSEKASCTTVLHRIAAVRGAVNGLMDEVIAAHLQDHVADPDLTEAARAQGAEELLTVIRRYSK